MGSLNKIQLIGNLGQDAEIKESSNGNTFLSFSIATSKYNKDMKTSEPVWHNSIQYWAPRGKPESLDKLAPYMAKGKQIYVEGSLDYYKDKDGVRRVSIKANNIELLGEKGDVVESNAPVETTKDSSVFGREPIRPVSNEEEPPF